MFNPEIIHKIEAVNRYTPRAVHDCFGIDYNKPFFAASIRGPFTVSKAEKAITAGGIDPRNAENIILIRDPAHSYRNEWRVVTMDGRGGFDIEHRDNYYRMECTRRRAGFDNYYRKADFNEDRKSGTAEAVIISQHAEHLHKPAEKTLDPAERYKVVNFNLCRYADRNETYISRITLQRTNDHGTRAEIGNTSRVIYRGYWEPATVEDAIDKSGYLVYDRRREWKRRARALRAERAKTAANAVDYSGQLAELDRLFTERKKAIAAALEAAETPNQIKKIHTMIDDYKTGLYWAAYDLEAFRDAAENKKFTSPEKARAAYESIRAKMDPASAGEEAQTA